MCKKPHYHRNWYWISIQVGIKQLEPVYDNSNSIIDYSRYYMREDESAKNTFLRGDIEFYLRLVIGDRMKWICASINVIVVYEFQELSIISRLIMMGNLSSLFSYHCFEAMANQISNQVKGIFEENPIRNKVGKDWIIKLFQSKTAVEIAT